MSFFPTPILVGTDGDPASRHALVAACELASATGSPVHLVHVELRSGTLHGRPMTPVQRERSASEAEDLLAREVAHAAEMGVEVAGTHLRFADRVDRAVVEVQEQLGAGLLVIGERGQGSLASALMRPGGTGSTGAVRRSRASVLVIREREGLRPTI